MSGAETASVTPNDMPGNKSQAAPSDTTAEKSESTEVKTSKAESATKDATNGALDDSERAELERLRGVHKDEQKWRREATDNHRDAEAYRELLKKLGVEDGKEKKGFDPQAAFTDLQKQFETERQARIRAEVARTEGVEPEDFSGSTEEEMRASAKRFKARIDAEVEKRASKVAPAAAPAGEVTSNGKVDGPAQITSRDELKNMTRQQRIEAHKSGRLDGLMSGTT